jgi:hypothetical protein
MRWAEINRLGNSIHHHFNEYDNLARAAARSAVADNDRIRWRKITDARTAAREAKDEILDLLESEMLQEATVTEVVNALEANAAKARKLLDRMKAAGKTLDTVKKGAELATKILGTVKKILVV